MYSPEPEIRIIAPRVPRSADSKRAIPRLDDIADVYHAQVAAGGGQEGGGEEEEDEPMCVAVANAVVDEYTVMV